MMIVISLIRDNVFYEMIWTILFLLTYRLNFLKEVTKLLQYVIDFCSVVTYWILWHHRHDIDIITLQWSWWYCSNPDDIPDPDDSGVIRCKWLVSFTLSFIVIITLFIFSFTYRTIFFGPPGNSKAPFLFFLLSTLFWGYPMYLFRVSGTCSNMHSSHLWVQY